MANVLFFVLDLLGFSDAPTSHTHYTLSLFLSAESRESLHHRPPPGMSRKCMYGGDDHLAWKRPVTSKTCRMLRTTGGYDRSY